MISVVSRCQCRLIPFLLSMGLFSSICHFVLADSPSQSNVVLDIEKLRTVAVQHGFTESPTCQVLVVGGGLGGVAAAEVLAEHGISVILTEPSSHLGGQLTVEGESAPDENDYIEDDDGPGTRNYRNLRQFVRTYYAHQRGVIRYRESNIGSCWNSFITAEPSVWEEGIDQRLALLKGPHRIRRILLREAPVDVHFYPGNGKISFVDLVNLDTGKLIRIGAQYVLDATETGDMLALAGVPWTLGQEPQSEYGEPDAPVSAEPNWIQSFTYCFILKRDENPAASPECPEQYDFNRSLGQYTLLYQSSYLRPPVQYAMFNRASGTAGPFWTYRRLIATSNFVDNPDFSHDLSLINWSGNDFRLASFIGLPPVQQVSILQAARDFSAGFRYWLQTECSRNGSGYGYPDLTTVSGVLGDDGMAEMPYIRESRRLLAVTTLTENDMVPDRSRTDQISGTHFFDAVGIADYPIDVHPAIGEAPQIIETLPYELPLGSFIPRSGPQNIIPAAADFGASRLAMASARVHPSEWLAGEIAGHLASFCLDNDVVPTSVRLSPVLLHAFQSELVRDGVNIDWSRELTESRR